jgi:chromosome segregation ATPase
MESAAITEEIERLERELGDMRSHLENDNSSFSSLEQQVAELRSRLAETQESLQKQEAMLEQKRSELAEAQRRERLEAYTEDLEKYRAARTSVSDAAATFLAELDAYDGEMVRLRRLRDEMRDVFGDDERAAEVDAALAEEDEALRTTWASVLGATDWRQVEAPPEPAVEPVSDWDEPIANADENGDLDDDLNKRAAEGRTARILDYFNKT